MRKKRFDEIMRCFHAADYYQLLAKDKFAKVSLFVEILNKNFIKYSAAFGPANISIDESMVPHLGMHLSKQFIRGKQISWGYKAWVAASPFGYIFSLSLYQENFRGTTTEYRSRFVLDGEVVLDFLDILSNHHTETKVSLYLDNYFSSIGLMEEVQKRGHRATGTIRSSRTEKCPFSNNKSLSKLPRGSEKHSQERLKNPGCPMERH